MTPASGVTTRVANLHAALHTLSGRACALKRCPLLADARTLITDAESAGRVLRAERAHRELCGADGDGYPLCGWGWSNCPRMRTCRHCGDAGPAGTDHTCPCPQPDDDCPVHPMGARP